MTSDIETRLNSLCRAAGLGKRAEEIVARLRRSLLELFPERHLYVRQGGEMRAFVRARRRRASAKASGNVASATTAVAAPAPASPNDMRLDEA